MSELTATIGQIGDSGEFVRLPDTAIAGAGKIAVENKTVTIPGPELGDRDIYVERWGADNRHPTKVREMVEKVPMAGQAIERRVRMLYGNGIYYYKNSDLNDGNTTVKRHYDADIERWLRHNRIRTHWYPNQCMDYVLYNNAFSQISCNKLTGKVTAIYHKSAEHCRISAQRKDGRSYFVLYSPHWVLGHVNSQDYVAIRLYQWDDREAFLASQRSDMYAWHTTGPGLGGLVYPNPPHEGLFREKGWIEVAQGVPEIVNAMQKNQVTIKYQIHISEQYFLWRHAKWATLSNKDKDKIFDAKVSDITKALSGTDNVAKSIATITRQDNFDGKEKGWIRIEPIDDKLKRDSWVPSSDAADVQIIQGLGNDPALVGLQGSNSAMGGNAGSTKRESYNVGIELNNLDQENILEPLNHAAELNGWDVTFMISHTAHTTKNVNERGVAPDATTIQMQE